jgi:N-methylhydantoinase A
VSQVEIGVDIGGTFTDIVARLENGTAVTHKVLTSPHDPSLGVLQGVRQLLAITSLEPARVARVVHGTTLVANAILERRGAHTALLTTEGFRDVLEIGRERRFDVYDLSIQRPEPIVPRWLRFEVAERLAPNGEVILPLDVAALATVVEALGAEHVESLAVVFLHSFRNDAHELAAAEVISEALPELSLTLSAVVAPEIGEFERSSTAVLNAYVKPLVAGYVGRLRAGLDAMGVTGPLLLMQSNGGFIDHQVAAEYPIRLLESGPAAGVVYASRQADSAAPLGVMSFDMGGTTAKTCFIENGEPARTRDFEVARSHRFKRNSGLPVRIAAVDMVEIGAGGGSVVSVSPLGLLQVGPESQGADPGPACYGLGGIEPTVTDADLLLGYLDPDYFLGGEMRLDLAASETVFGAIALQVGMAVPQVAWGVHEVVTDNMAHQARMHAAEKALDLTRHTMVAFGGAGPLHAYRLARKLGISQILVPPYAGVASALGLLQAPAMFHEVQALMGSLKELDVATLNDIFIEMERVGRDRVSAAAGPGAAVGLARAVDLRYRGQGYELEVDVPPGILSDGLLEEVRTTFEGLYDATYGRRLPSVDVEALNWRVVASATRPPVSIPMPTATDPLASYSRSIFDPDREVFTDAAILQRDELRVGWCGDGPAVIQDRQCTLVVGSRGSIAIDTSGSVVVQLG